MPLLPSCDIIGTSGLQPKHQDSPKMRRGHLSCKLIYVVKTQWLLPAALPSASLTFRLWPMGGPLEPRPVTQGLLCSPEGHCQGSPGPGGAR